MLKMKNSLYLVLTEEYCRKPAIDVAKEALRAGVDVLQMREKNKPKEELLRLGKELGALCTDIPFIVNDDPYLANELDADGVHLGQEDYKKYLDVRKIMKDKIIGLSTHSVEEVKQANNLDVDYLAFGPIFETKTKDYSIGASDVEQVLNIATKPLVFIGGINENNIDELIKQGANNIAVIRAITGAKDIASSVKKLKNKIGARFFITLNGKKELVRSRTLPSLLIEKNFNPETVVVEYNYAVTKPAEWKNINIKENDNLEIVGFFAGG
jgi:thiamine-phosphate pyrophosphorylase